jgi:hypothetical protein
MAPFPREARVAGGGLDPAVCGMHEFVRAILWSHPRDLGPPTAIGGGKDARLYRIV